MKKKFIKITADNIELIRHRISQFMERHAYVSAVWYYKSGIQYNAIFKPEKNRRKIEHSRPNYFCNAIKGSLVEIDDTCIAPDKFIRITSGNSATVLRTEDWIRITPTHVFIWRHDCSHEEMCETIWTPISASLGKKALKIQNELDYDMRQHDRDFPIPHYKIEMH